MKAKQIFGRWKTVIAFAMVLLAGVLTVTTATMQPIQAAQYQSDATKFNDIGTAHDTRPLVDIMKDTYNVTPIGMNFKNGWVKDSGNISIKEHLSNTTDEGNPLVTAIVANGDSKDATWHTISENCFSYFDKETMSQKKGSIRFDFTLDSIDVSQVSTKKAVVAYIREDSHAVMNASAFKLDGSTISAFGGIPGVKETITATFIDKDTEKKLSKEEVPSTFWGFYDIDIWDKLHAGGLESDKQKGYPKPSKDGTKIEDDVSFAETVTLKSGFTQAYRRDNDHSIYMTDGTIFPSKETDPPASYGESAAIASLKSSSATIKWTGSCCSTGVYSMSLAKFPKASVKKEVSIDKGTWSNEAYVENAGDKVYYKITLQLPYVDPNIDPTPYSSIVVRDRFDWLTVIGDKNASGVTVESSSTGGAAAWKKERIGDTRSVKFTYNHVNSGDDSVNASTLMGKNKGDDSKRQLKLIISVSTKSLEDGNDDAYVQDPNDEDPPSGEGKDAQHHPKSYRRRKSKKANGKTYKKLYNKAHAYFDSDKEDTATVNPYVPITTGVNIVIAKAADDATGISQGIFGDDNVYVTKTGAIYEIQKKNSEGKYTNAEERHGTWYFKTNAADDSVPDRFAQSVTGRIVWHSEKDTEGTVSVGNGGDNDAAFGVGTYKITEIQAPKDFYGNLQSQEITITQQDVDDGETQYVTFKNPRPVGKIHIKKKIGDSGCNYKIENLAGNTFAIFAKDDVYNPRDGSVKYAAGTQVTTITTDANGDAYTGYLPLGTYRAVETGVASGLLKNNNNASMDNLKLERDGWTDTVYDVGEAYGEHANYPTMTRFRKLSELTDTTNTQNGLAGATLQVLDPSASNQVVAQGTTDASGIFTVSGLQADHDYIVHEAIPAPNYTAAPDQAFHTTTQTETNSTQVVGLNAQWYDNWCDYGTGYNSATATGTRIIDAPQYYSLKLYKRIDASDPWISNDQNSYGHGEPTFLFKIDGTDFRGKHVTYYRTFTFTKGEIDNAGHSGWLEHMRDVKVRAGTYTVTEVKSMRYKVTEVHRHVNAAVNADNQSATVTLDVNHPSAEVGFTNRTTNYNDWSHVHVTVNAFRNAYTNSDSTHHPMAQERDETEQKV